MSLLSRALLGALLLSFLPTLFAASFSFNPIYISDCLAENENGGCSFSNASLWIDNSNPNATNATLPGPGDSVDISSPSLISLQIDDTVQIASLSLKNASLTVNGSLATSASIYLDVAGTLKINPNANVTAPPGNATFTLTLASFLFIETGGNFVWHGKGSFLGTVEVAVNSTFVVNTANPFSPFDMTFSSTLSIGYLWVSNIALFNAGLEVFSLIATVNSTVWIRRAFSGAITLDEGSDVQFLRVANFVVYPETEVPPISGTGSLTIFKSNGVINSTTPSTFNGTVYVGEASNVTLVGLTLPNLDTEDDVTLFANGVVLSGNNVTLPGQLVAQENGLTISGSPYRASVIVDSSLTVSGIFFPIQLQLNEGSQIKLAGLIHDSLTIPSSSALLVTSSSQIVGSLVNQGSLNVTTTNSLEIWSGDYTQNNGTFSVELDNTNQAALNVLNGSIFLNGGGIQFSIKDKPFLRSAKFLVAQANTTINGTFAGDATPLASSAITRTLSVKYEENPNAIYIQYSFNPKDVEYWMWILLGVIVAILLIVIMALVIKYRRRNRYESLGR